MALAHIQGLDHVVVLVRDLSAAAAAWGGLGFTVSPPGRHSPHKGTGNHTLMLGEDYVELLGILADTPLNVADRSGLAEHGEGVDRAAMRTDDAEGGLAAVRALGLAATGPQAFSRPVELPGGGTAEAAFRTFDWPPESSPGGLRLFACEHRTPEAVWIPELTRHANSARGIARLEMLSAHPDAEASEMARLIGSDAEPCPDGAWRVTTGSGRADLVFLDPSLLATRHPGVPVVDSRSAGAAALVLRVESLDAVLGCVPAAIRTGEHRLSVPPEAATGVLLAFEEG